MKQFRLIAGEGGVSWSQSSPPKRDRDAAQERLPGNSFGLKSPAYKPTPCPGLGRNHGHGEGKRTFPNSAGPSGPANLFEAAHKAAQQKASKRVHTFVALKKNGAAGVRSGVQEY